MTVADRPLNIRVATRADVPIVLDLVRSAYRGDSSREGWTTEADYLADERIDEAGLLAKIEAPTGAVLVVFGATSATTAGPGHHPATEEEALLACCEVLRHPEPSKTAHFGLFAVRPRLQNGGIGKQVLGAAERYATERLGAERMELWTVWLREELIAWYTRRGYTLLEGETRPFPYEHLVNGEALRDDLYFVVMEKALV